MSTLPEDVINNPERLATLQYLSLLDSPAEAAFDRLTRLAAKLLDAPTTVISLVAADRQFFKSESGMAEPWASLRGTPLSHSFCKHVVATGEPLIIEDARLHPLVHDNPAIPDMGVISYAGIPLLSPGGEVLGTFCAVHALPHRWTEEELVILKDLTAAAMTEIALRSELLERRQIETELRRSENALLIAYDSEKKLGQMRAQFMSMISHDFRTPLTVIQSSSDLIKRYAGRLTEAQKQIHFDKIHRQVQRLTEMLDDILTISKGEADELKLTRIEFDPEKFGRELADEVQLMAGDTHQIVYQYSGGHQPGQADTTLMGRAVANLLSNAVKYSPSGSKIVFEIACEPESIVIRIQDSGIGISAQDLPHLFETFYRATNVGDIPGTGLGLAIVKQIVEAHEGHISVQSEIGAGTTFVVTIPAGPQAAYSAR